MHSFSLVGVTARDLLSGPESPTGLYVYVLDGLHWDTHPTTVLAQPLQRTKSDKGRKSWQASWQGNKGRNFILRMCLSTFLPLVPLR